ncbi:MAG: Fic family protein [Acidimicrobiaceae bacterium]|nr:Fic family protein [Acidimicrobiaceae bacterium]
MPGQSGRPTHLQVYERLQIQVAELRENLGGLPLPEEASDIWRGIWYAEAHHSTALEGNTLVLRQVEQLLGEGRAVGSKDLGEYLEVKGYGDAAEWVYSQARRPAGLGEHQRVVTLAEVREIHRAVLAPAWEVSPHPNATPAESPGSYRRHDIRPFPDGMTPISWPLVSAEMAEWEKQVNLLDSDELTFPEALAAAHCRFEQIHPFLDGNGRTGRLALNLVLVRLGFPPAIIYKRDRDRYLRALHKADDGDPGPLGAMLARSMLDSLYRFVLPAVAGPARLVPLEALASSEISDVALRGAANRGRLQATRGSDGRWRSSRRWVDEYLASRYRRTPL